MSESAAGPSPTTEFDSDTFRSVMSRYATGVCVVTTHQDGMDHAMTANSFTSVSLDPPLVLVCVETETRFYDAITAVGQWGVSVLREVARPRAVWLATRGRPLAGQLDVVPLERGPQTGVALLRESLARLECRTTASYQAGDHHVVIGEVLTVQQESESVDPLLYYASTYHQLGERSGR